MSFKKFSASQTAAGNSKPDDKAKAAPAVSGPASHPAAKQDEIASAQK